MSPAQRTQRRERRVEVKEDRRDIKPRFSRYLWMIGTAAASAGLASVWLPWSIVALWMLVLFAHELGHVLVAFARGANPYPPVFIPLGVITIGITRIPELAELSPRHRRYLHLAGPIAGASACFALLPLALWSQLSLALALLLVSELANGTIGPDGKNWRKDAHAYRSSRASKRTTKPVVA